MNDTLLGDLPEDMPVVDQSKNYLTELVGDGKKFKSAEELARGKYEADLYVKSLEKKMDELRSDYLKVSEDASSRAKLEDLIGQLESKQQPHISNDNPVKDVKQMPVIDSKEIESLVSNKIQEYELTKRQQENFNVVRNRLKEQFGDNFQNALKQQIADLGLSEEDINALAKKSPSALFKTLGMEQKAIEQSYRPPIASSQKPETFRPKGKDIRSWSYYQQMKKDNPKLYYDPKTNVQMHNDAIELGAAFQDGDFNAFG